MYGRHRPRRQLRPLEAPVACRFAQVQAHTRESGLLRLLAAAAAAAPRTGQQRIPQLEHRITERHIHRWRRRRRRRGRRRRLAAVSTGGCRRRRRRHCSCHAVGQAVALDLAAVLPGGEVASLPVYMYIYIYVCVCVCVCVCVFLCDSGRRVAVWRRQGAAGGGGRSCRVWPCSSPPLPSSSPDDLR